MYSKHEIIRAILDNLVLLSDLNVGFNCIIMDSICSPHLRPLLDNFVHRG